MRLEAETTTAREDTIRGDPASRSASRINARTARRAAKAYRDLVDKRGARAMVWLVVALAAGLAIFLAWGFQTGVCFDGPDPATSGCTIGPAIGVPGAVVVTVASAGVIALAVRRLVSLFSASEPQRTA